MENLDKVESRSLFGYRWYCFSVNFYLKVANIPRSWFDSTPFSVFTSRHGGHVVERIIAKKVFWEFDSIIMLKLCYYYAKAIIMLKLNDKGPFYSCVLSCLAFE